MSCDQTCRIPRCRQAASINYLGYGLCASHWLRLSSAEAWSEVERGLLRDLHMTRDEAGQVIELRKGSQHDATRT